ncbi:MAG: hypothetical protein RR332_00425 [Clostridiales bacterium]
MAVVFGVCCCTDVVRLLYGQKLEPSTAGLPENFEITAGQFY